MAGDDVDFNPISNGIYYKLHLPADVRPTFDLTFSGYTLSELNGPTSRIAAVKHLLKCTRKYIVFVENGTLRSHHLIEELREYVASNFSDEFEIFAPCPHMKPCPILMTNLNQQRKSLICRNWVSYLPFPVRNHPTPESERELFTYLILRRRQKAEFDPETVSDFSPENEKEVNQRFDSLMDDDMKWPRVVQEPLKRKSHVTMRLCCSDGTACESIVSKGKHPLFFYRSCRKAELGDRLPLPHVGTEELHSELSDPPNYDDSSASDQKDENNKPDDDDL